jgi:hypothetical protein
MLHLEFGPAAPGALQDRLPIISACNATIVTAPMM